MRSEIEPVNDGTGLAVIGNPTDVERLLLDQGLAVSEGSPVEPPHEDDDPLDEGARHDNG